jgi:hypothetical protein
MGETNPLQGTSSHSLMQSLSQRYIYHFDDPALQESGSVQILANKVIIQFPERINTKPTVPENHTQIINLYVDNQLLFSSQWVPVMTFNDHIRFKEMLYKAYVEFTQASNKPFLPFDPYSSNLHHEFVSEIDNSYFNVYCFENYLTTSIELKFKKCICEEHETLPCHLQFFVGSHLVFCSEKNIKNCCSDLMLSLLTFILYKCNK